MVCGETIYKKYKIEINLYNLFIRKMETNNTKME